MKHLYPFFSLCNPVWLWKTYFVSLLLVFFYVSASAQTFNQVPDNLEYQALVDLYNSTNGPNWNNKTNWLNGTSHTDFATWRGVSVYNGDVVGLYLGSNKISGPIPASIGQLSKLVNLEAYHNQLTGLPNEICNLLELTYINLDGNLIAGPIPANIGNLTKLSRLAMGGNRFTGGIPASVGNLKQLHTLALGGNLLTDPLPVEIGGMSNLQNLYINSNKISGPIPASIGQLSKLVNLEAYHNQLTGLPNMQQMPNRARMYINIDGNNMGFLSIERNFVGPNVHSFSTFKYNPQGVVLVNDQDKVSSDFVYNLYYLKGQPLRMEVQDGGVHTVYQWQRLVSNSWQNLPGATGKVYSIANGQQEHAGSYRCVLTNSWVSGVTLLSHTIKAAVTPIAISSFSPASGKPGDIVIISGTNLVEVTGVTFNGVAAAFSANEASQLVAIVPSGATSGKITISDPSRSVPGSGVFEVLHAYTWQGSSTNNWEEAGSWQPARTTPTAHDVLVFDRAVTPVATVKLSSSERIGQLKLMNDVAATVVVEAAKTITLDSSVSGTDLSIAPGCSLIVNKVNGQASLTIDLPPGNTASVKGQLKL